MKLVILIFCTFLIACSQIPPHSSDQEEIPRVGAQVVTTQDQKTLMGQERGSKDQLRDTIRLGIQLLESGRNREAMELLSNPDDLAAWKAYGWFDIEVEAFSKRDSRILLRNLRKALLIEPKREAEPETATFEENGVPFLGFHLYGREWRLDR